MSNCRRLQPKPAPVKCWPREPYLRFSWRGIRHKSLYTNRRGILLREQWTTFYKKMALKKEARPPPLRQTDKTDRAVPTHTSFPSVFLQLHYVGERYQKRKKQISVSCQRKHHDCWLHRLVGSDPCLKDSEMGALMNSWCPFSKPGNSRSLASSCSVCRNRSSFCTFIYHTTHYSNTCPIMCLVIIFLFSMMSIKTK